MEAVMFCGGPFSLFLHAVLGDHRTELLTILCNMLGPEPDLKMRVNNAGLYGTLPYNVGPKMPNFGWFYDDIAT